MTVKVKLFAVVGVPLSTPPLDRVSPVGRVPEEAKTYGPVPPLAVIVWLYAVPTTPFGSVEGDSVIGPAEELLRGFTVPAVKSELLLSVSVQPLFARRSDVVALGAGVGPPPSKQLAVLPNPTKSTMVAPVGQAPMSAVVLLTSATFP